MLERIMNIILREREKQGIKYTELAKKAGISYMQLCNIRNGRDTTISTIERLLNAVDIKDFHILCSYELNKKNDEN